MYATHDESAAQVAVDGARTLSYIKNVLKADAVSIVWAYSSPGYHSNAVKATSQTLSSANVATLTQMALADGLQVEYRPLIFVKGVKNSWEYLIRPSSPARFLRNNYRAELPYLKVAQQYGADEFVTATELRPFGTARLWKSFFKRVSKVYQGTVSFSAYDQDYVHQRLLPARSVGMDMYHRMNLPRKASSARVTASWEKWFSQVPRSLLRLTAMDEVGIAARAGAYHNPWDLGAKGTLDETIQLNWFTAACNTVRKYHMRGVFFWKVDLADNPSSPSKALSVFEGRKGARAIAACASILH